MVEAAAAHATLPAPPCTTQQPLSHRQPPYKHRAACTLDRRSRSATGSLASIPEAPSVVADSLMHPPHTISSALQQEVSTRCSPWPRLRLQSSHREHSLLASARARVRTCREDTDRWQYHANAGSAGLNVAVEQPSPSLIQLSHSTPLSPAAARSSWTSILHPITVSSTTPTNRTPLHAAALHRARAPTSVGSDAPLLCCRTLCPPSPLLPSAMTASEPALPPHLHHQLTLTAAHSSTTTTTTDSSSRTRTAASAVVCSRRSLLR